MGPFTRDGAYYSARIDRRSLLLLRQLVSEILVVLDDPSDAEEMSIMVSASTGPEVKRDAPVERSLEFLLPPMSADAQTAQSLRALTEDIVRSDKSRRLRVFWRILDGAVPVRGRPWASDSDEADLRVRAADAWQCLGALNDIRLGLAGELGMETASDAEAVEALAMSEPTGEHTQSVAIIYMLVTWWQDSLLTAMQEHHED